MLQQPAPYPYVGSNALLIDEDAAAPAAAELVRIVMRREGEVVVSFPLRDGAQGNKRVDPAQLIDATPLTPAETREFHDLDRALFGRQVRTPKQKHAKARRDALHLRMVWAPYLAEQLRQARGKAARQKWAA